MSDDKAKKPPANSAVERFIWKPGDLVLLTPEDKPKPKKADENDEIAAKFRELMSS